MVAIDALRPGAGCVGGCLISSSAEESNYWSIQCDCVTDPRSPDLGALLVAIEYCIALEGPFWRKIRGKGLAYGYNLRHNLELGTINFELFKATNPVDAYSTAKDIISKLCAEPSGNARMDKAPEDEEEQEEEEEIGLDPSALEGAQSGVLFGLIESVDTVPKAMSEYWANTLQRRPFDQLQWLLKEVQAVTIEAAKEALRTHVLPLFSGSKGRTVSAICPAQKREQVQEGLLKLDPPFRLTHVDVDDLVKTIAPRGGFQMLRKKAEQAKAESGEPSFSPPVR